MACSWEKVLQQADQVVFVVKMKMIDSMCSNEYLILRSTLLLPY